MRKYNWGIIAPWGIAHKFDQGLAVLPGAVSYAVASRDIGRAREFAGKYGFTKAYGSYDELIADPDVDIVYIASPHIYHEEHTIKSLNNKKAVLCEKPFAISAAQVKRMIENARKNNVFLMEAMWTHFLPSIRKTRELIANGAIGKVRNISAAFCFKADVNPKSRLFSPDLAGGSVLDVGVYNFALCSMIFGKQPDKIYSHMEIGSTGVDETTAVLLSYNDNKSANLITSMRFKTNHEAVIYGEDGYIRLPSYWKGNMLLLTDNQGTREIKLPFESTGYQFEAAEVMECMEKGLKESPVVPLDDSLEIMKIVDKIRFDNNLFYPFEKGNK